VVQCGEKEGRALVSYLVDPVLNPDSVPSKTMFSNAGIALSMVDVLVELGFAVDVVNYDDRRFRPRARYDLFIGHGGTNYQGIDNSLPPDCCKIYFSTGSYWKTHNAAELARAEYLWQRRGIRLPPDRFISESEEWANVRANAIVALGNERVRASYERFDRVYVLNNAAYPDTHFLANPKDFEAGRKNFLFYAGPGNLHKGLDLVLEAFASSDAHVFICQEISEDFASAFCRELALRNIHALGFVPARSPDFYEVVAKCNTVILPSCSEGSPGSVIECLHQGLIPVVTPECNLDVGDIGVIITDGTVEAVTRAIQDVANWPVERHSSAAYRAYHAACSVFSEESFRQNLKHIIAGCMEDT
jgi:glycosyltransferase involved in cell wall biosynthesis